jgi:D-sedoheptulose 7-phosphate isomerase
VNYFHELQIAISQIDPTPLLDFIKGCNGTLWLAGNGGSASTAQHWACDLSKAAGRRVQALGSNPAVLTAWANDHSYHEIFSRELWNIGRPDDALICLSCSGTSFNVAAAVRQARMMGMQAALLTSTLCKKSDANVTIRIPHTHYGIIEDCHLAIGHWLTEELQK